MNSAVCSQSGTIEWSDAGGSGRTQAMSGIVSDMPNAVRRRQPRPTRMSLVCHPLSRLLREAAIRSINFFSLDVEGGELSVLQTMDWNIAVDVLIVELDGTNAKKDALCRELLASKGMRMAGRMGLNNANDVWLGPNARYVNKFGLS